MLIYPGPGEAGALAQKLIDAAGGDASLVKTSTQGPSLAFDVPDEVGRAIGRTPDQTSTDTDTAAGSDADADAGGGKKK